METIKNMIGEEINGAFGPFQLSNGQKIAILEGKKCYRILVEKKKGGFYTNATTLPKNATKEEIVNLLDGNTRVEGIDFPSIYAFNATTEECRKVYYAFLNEIAAIIVKDASEINNEEVEETSAKRNEKNEEPAELASKDELANVKDKNIWKGSRYNPALTREEIVDLVNDYVYDKYKIDYRFDIYMIYRRGSSKIVIKLIEGPVPAFTNPDRTYIDTWKFYEENEKEVQKEILDVMNDVYDYAASFRYEKTIDEDDPCEFETNFTLNVKIGEKDRPYRCRE